MESELSREKVIDDLYLFLRTLYHYERSIARRYGLNYQEIYLLQNLRRNSSERLTEIANLLDVPMFAASRLVERLLEKKLVDKEKNAHDRRSISVSLLPEGERIVRVIEQESYERIRQGSHDLSQEKFAEMLGVVERLYQVLGIPERLVR